MPIPNRLSIIVAVAENGVIGREGQLPWRLSSDLRRFKSLTMGHAIIMGRKTFDSIDRLLPGRQTVVITSQKGWSLEGAIVCHSFDEAIHVTRADSEPFVIGGASVYVPALAVANRLYLTRVEGKIDGDVKFPKVNWREWELCSSEYFEADRRNDHAHRFEIYERRLGV